MLLILHYIDQICSRMPLFTLNTLTCHRFVIAAVTVSSKGLCDTFCTNNLYAKVGGITVQELNMLEREFLSAIEWRLTVSKFLFPVRSPTSTPTCRSRAESNPLATCLPYWTMPCFFFFTPLLVHSRSPPRVLCQSRQDQRQRAIHDHRTAFLK